MFRCLFLCALLFPALCVRGADLPPPPSTTSSATPSATPAIPATDSLARHTDDPRPPSGIPAIDSLPLNDWKIQSTRLSIPKAVALSAIFPGGGQFYGGHPVRGSFLLGLETTLFGLSLYTYLVTLPQYDRITSHYLDNANASFRLGNTSDFQGWIQNARDNGIKRIEEADLANSELAWAIGLHFYGMADALEIAHRSQGFTSPVLSVKRAMFYGLIFPGGGQLYTGNYGKFGMLWMALGAAGLSAWSRQNVVESLSQLSSDAQAEQNTSESANLDIDLVAYRKNRNEYYWAMALLYVYGVLDGMVDAALSDFDSPSRYALGPGPTPISLSVNLHF